MNDNNLITEKSWWKRNRKWFIPTSILSFLLFIGIILSIGNEGSVTDIVKAYSEDSLYNEAIETVNKNPKVAKILGKIQSADELAILEGNVVYSNNGNSIETTIRIKGNKGKAKMDISAEKSGSKWTYKKINVRIKEPMEEIIILE